MPTSSLVSDTLTITDPSFSVLQSDNISADAYAPAELQRGLSRDLDGKVVIKPEIRARLHADRRDLIEKLIIENRLPEANSVLACRMIHKVLNHCPHWHEANVAKILCSKWFLCADCASSVARVHRFEYDHPTLYAQLLSSKFQVLTFLIDHDEDDERPERPEGSVGAKVRAGLEAANLHFKAFIEEYSSKEHQDGWQFLAAFDDNPSNDYFQCTKFFAIHMGQTLPAWATLNAQWRAIAGPGASLRIQTFDGRDGDTQEKGLKLAFSGFDGYYSTARDMDGWPLPDLSREFAGYAITQIYGAFRGMEPDEPQAPEDDAQYPVCQSCGEHHVSGADAPLMTIEELEDKGNGSIRLHFGHSKPSAYGGNPYSNPCSHKHRHK